MKKALVIAVALTLVLSGLAYAANNPAAKAAIHVRPHDAKAVATSPGTWSQIKGAFE